MDICADRGIVTQTVQSHSTPKVLFFSLLGNFGVVAIQSKELTEFYNGYVQWVEDGAPKDHPIYARCHGLCNSAWKFKGDCSLECELTFQFAKHNLSIVSPFNDSFSAYRWEGDDNTMHLNSFRLQWCKDRLAEATSIKDRIEEVEQCVLRINT